MTVSYTSDTRWKEAGNHQGKTTVGVAMAYTDAVKVLWREDLAEVDANTGPAVLTEQLILLLCVETVRAAAFTAVVTPSNR